jgi:hypothetical protein
MSRPFRIHKDGGGWRLAVYRDDDLVMLYTLETWSEAIYMVDYMLKEIP